VVTRADHQPGGSANDAIAPKIHQPDASRFNFAKIHRFGSSTVTLWSRNGDPRLGRVVGGDCGNTQLGRGE
jgi:hypothetical protein